ncbi:MAG: hypothetical protein EXS68_02335 [Candidatus Ryanbacteria bacterium]|nr:hypothetical protein [Candidatus Ryanbacteria bacterium]
MVDYIIRKAERFFRFDIRYILANSFWIGSGKVLATLAAFFLSVLYARYLPKAVYGDYRYILSVLSIAGIFAVPGIGTAMARAIARGFEGTFRHGGRFIFLASFGISIVGIGCALFFFYNGNIYLGWGFALCALFFPFVEGMGNWRNYYDGKRLFKEKTVLNTIDQLAYTICMAGAIGAIIFLKLDAGTSLLILLLAYTLGEGLPNIVFFLQTLKKIPKNAPGEPGALRYGLHLSIANIPATIANYLDVVLLYAFMSPAAVAIYSFALALPEQLKSYLGIVTDISFPKLAVQSQNAESLRDLKKTLVTKAIKASYVTCAIVLAYIIAAPLIYSTFFPRYTEAIYLSQIFALSLVLFPFGVFNTALKAEGDMQKIYGYNVIAPVIQIAALVTLIPPYGLWGAVSARMIGRVANHILPLLFFIKK